MTHNLYFFTVLTPTYNRVHTLERVYRSLCEQQFKDFEWLVIDDGSTDNTREKIETWQGDSPFPIRYVWQLNQHKKTAFNTGVKQAWGRLIVALDSDDSLLPDSLQSMADVWRGIPDDLKSGYIAVTGLCARPDGSIVGDRFPEDVMDMTTLDMSFKHHVKGEKFGCLQTQVLKHYPFPEDIEGFVPESVVWRAIARDGYMTRFVNTVFRKYYESADSLTMEGESSVNRHAMGILLLARDTVVNCLPWFRYQPVAFLLAAARYTRFRLHLQHDGRPLPPTAELQGKMSRLLVWLMYPVGWALYLKDRRGSAERLSN
ncbi:glycosyl transferase [Advenella sp. S44]|uniref:glycosyltransferase family 2 protein n=1 Tax=Advenella sp. S44 TaxID=1982755 RepID=UPI000C29F01F|nr:glycosyltransferase family 2 protein [Advenella sp. S44]PJX26642.1 glycosyl transferase [Advenella sp. S44]